MNDVVSVTIPLTFKLNPDLRLNGIATDGTINGSSEGIEKSTPITAEVLYDHQGSSYAQSAVLNKIKVTPLYSRKVNVDREIYSNATSQNGNTEYMRFILLNAQGYSMLPFVEEFEYEMLLPQGISINVLDVLTRNAFDITTEVLGTGQTKMTFVKKPTYSYSSRNVAMNIAIAESLVADVPAGGTRTFNIGVTYKKIRFRNFTADTNLANNSGSIENVANYLIFPVTYTRLSDTETIGYFGTTQKMAINSEQITSGTISYVRSANTVNNYTDFYTALGYLPYDFFLVNMDTQNATRPKEVLFEFPTSDKFEVKGIRLWKNTGYTMTTIKVKTKNNPTQQTHTVNYSGNGLKFVDVVSLGYSADDVLTEVIMPIGAIPAKGSIKQDKFGRQADVFGILKVPSAISSSPIQLDKITIRDENYDANSVDRNYSQLALKQLVEISNDFTRNNVRIDMPNSQVVNGYETATLNYIIKNKILDGGQHWGDQNGFTEVSKVAVVYPKEITVKSITFTNSNGVTITATPLAVREQDDKKIYTYDLSQTSGTDNIIGWIGTPGQGFNENFITAKVEIENTSFSTTIYPLTKTLYVETLQNRHFFNSGLVARGQDIYDINQNGATNDATVYTNASSSNTLTLVAIERVQLGIEAKLENETNYQPLQQGESFNLKSTTDRVNIKYNISNPTNKELGDIDLFLPIAKLNQNWGTNFQDEAFKFDMNLQNTLVGDTTFNQIFDVSYAHISNPQQYSIDQLKNFNWGVYTGESANMIRIKTKTGQKLAANTTYPITGTFQVANAENAVDGSMNSWNAFYRMILDSYGSLDVKTEKLNVKIALGRINVVAFNDINMNGIKDTGEVAIENLNIKVLSQNPTQGETPIVEGSTDNAGNMNIQGLVSQTTYTVKANNLDVDTYRFTNGNTDGNETATYQISATGIGQNVPTVYVGITNAKAVVKFITEIDKGLFSDDDTALLTEKTVTKFWNEKITPVPTIVNQGTFTFNGWIDSVTGAILQNSAIETMDLGRYVGRTFTANYSDIQANSYCITTRIPDPLKQGDEADAALYIEPSGLPEGVTYEWMDGTPSTCPQTSGVYYTKQRVKVTFPADQSAKIIDVVVLLEPRNDLYGVENITHELRTGQILTLTTGVTPSEDDFTYQWEKSTNLSEWTAIENATAPTYEVINQEVVTTYYRKVSTRNNCNITSYPIKVTVKQARAFINAIGTKR